MKSVHSKMQYDVLIVGAGLAGIRAAVSCSKAGKNVLLITSTRLCSGSSFYPLMDTLHCLCTAGSEDKELFYKDIKECSYGMNDPQMSKYYINHIEECIESLPETGIDIHKLPEKKIACFGHTFRDLYYWKNWDLIRKKVYETIQTNNNITLLEHTDLIQLLVSENKISGALLLNTDGIIQVSAKAVILAGGGMGSLYLHNLNTTDVNGSVHAVALKAGADLINLEYNQFIPGFISPVYKIVFREGSLRYCTGLFDPDGNNILKDLLPNNTRYGECLTLRETHGPFTFSDNSRYFDIALMKSILRHIETNGHISNYSSGCLIRYSPDILKDERGHVQDYINWLINEHNINIEKSNIFIAPFFHAANGGIHVNHNCSTRVNGLFACGECAGGIHGADRLGGMASGSCLVFGTLAAKSACDYINKVHFSSITPAEVYKQFNSSYKCCDPYLMKHSSDKTINIPFSPQNICIRVKELMWQYGNIIRNENGLTTAIETIDTMGLFLDQNLKLDDYNNVSTLKAFLRAHQYIDLSRALLISMSIRKESRGSHYREDYPQTDTLYGTQRTVIKLVDQKYNILQEPAPK